MKVINAFDGKACSPGETFRSPRSGLCRLERVRGGLFTATVSWSQPLRGTVTMQLPIRYGAVGGDRTISRYVVIPT